MKLTKTILLLFITFLLLAFANAVMAQDDMDDDEEMDATEELACVPETFETAYDQFKSDTITTRAVEIWYSFGSEKFKQKQYEEALPYYWKVLVNDQTGRYKVVYSKISTCYTELGKKNSAESKTYLDSTLLILYRGLEKYPTNATLNFYAGRMQRARNQPQCAIPHYEALVAGKPDEVRYLKVLAGLYFQVDDQKCLEVQQKVVELNPSNEANNLLIEMMNHFGMDPIVALKNAFERDKSNVRNAMRYGTEAYVIGDYNASLEAANAVITVDAQHTEAIGLKARSYEGLNQTSEAIKVYKEALQIDPKDIKTLCSIARAYSSLSNFSAARSNVIQAQRIDGGNGEPYMVMAQIYEDAVDYCSGKREDNDYTYEDKLVFERARGEYKKAQRDANFASTASTRYNNLAALVPTQEEIFMKNNRKTIKDDCYSWIQ